MGARNWLCGVIMLLAAPGAAHAQSPSPSNTVREFYLHVGLEMEASSRDRFVDPALKVLSQNDAIRATGDVGCLDPGIAIDSPNIDGVDPDSVPFDPAELATSLKLAETVRDAEAKVVVAFTRGGSPHRMEWKLKNVGGVWKVSDILSVTHEWALSQFNCE